MTQHAPLLPLLIPFAAALLQMLMPLARQRQVAALSAALSIASTLWLLVLCDAGPLRVYALGDWQPPFGIVLVADRLAALMVFCCAMLAAACVAYASAGADVPTADAIAPGRRAGRERPPACRPAHGRPTAARRAAARTASDAIAADGAGATRAPGAPAEEQRGCDAAINIARAHDGRAWTAG